MNPCPCGYYPGPKCRGTDYKIIKYRDKISGSIMDRIDIQKEAHPVDFFPMEDKKTVCSYKELQKKVEQAIGALNTKNSSVLHISELVI